MVSGFIPHFKRKNKIMPDNRFTFKVADVVRIVGEKVNNDHFQLLICKLKIIDILIFTYKKLLTLWIT